MRLVNFNFEKFGLAGKAVAFTPETFDRFLDDTIRNADDAARGLFIRAVAEVTQGDATEARRVFPLVVQRLSDVLTAEAGYVRESATMQDALDAGTPPGVLAHAGLSAEEAAGLLAKRRGKLDPLRVVVVHDADHEKIFACVLRAPSDAALGLLRKKGKGYGKACRSAALDSIAWSNKTPEEAFSEHPAIPGLVLAEILLEMGDDANARQFRGR